MHSSEGFHFGPWQPAHGHNASRRGPSDFAAASLRDHMTHEHLRDDTGDAAAAKEIEVGIFAPFVPTAPEQHARLVALGAILKDDVVCDLGFGDGTLLCGISQLAECTGCGCEIDGDLVASARALAASSGLEHSLVLTESAISRFVLTSEFRRATVIVCFLVPGQLQQLIPAFEAAMRLGVRIITQRYPIPGLAHLRCLDAGSRLENRPGRTDPFGWISQIEELRSEDQNRRQDEEYFPDQGPAFLYSHGP